MKEMIENAIEAHKNAWSEALESTYSTNIAKVENSRQSLEEAFAQVASFTTIKEDGSYIVTVTTPQESATVEMVEKALAAEIKKKLEEMEPDVQAANKLHKSLVARRDKAVQQYQALREGAISGNRLYLRKVEEERETERKLLQDIAIKEAEDKRLEEAKVLEYEASLLKSQGLIDIAKATKEEAESIINTPVYVPTVIMPPAPKVDQRKYGIKYSIEVIDKMKVIKFVTNNPQFSHLLDINIAQCNSLARAQKEQFNIPGIKLVIT